MLVLASYIISWTRLLSVQTTRFCMMAEPWHDGTASGERETVAAGEGARMQPSHAQLARMSGAGTGQDSPPNAGDCEGGGPQRPPRAEVLSTAAASQLVPPSLR